MYMCKNDDHVVENKKLTIGDVTMERPACNELQGLESLRTLNKPLFAAAGPTNFYSGPHPKLAQNWGVTTRQCLSLVTSHAYGGVDGGILGNNIT